MNWLSRWPVVAVGVVIAGCGPQPTKPADASPPTRAGSDAPAPSGKLPPTPPAPPAEEKETFKVVFADGKMSINGKPIPAFPNLDVVEAVLGKPSSIDESGRNTAVYWKEHGVKALKFKESQTLRTIEFNFFGQDNPGDGSSGMPFKGSVTLNGEKVIKNTRVAPLKEKLGLQKSPPLDHTLEITKGTVVTLKGGEVGAVLVEWSEKK